MGKIIKNIVKFSFLGALFVFVGIPVISYIIWFIVLFLTVIALSIIYDAQPETDMEILTPSLMGSYGGYSFDEIAVCDNDEYYYINGTNDMIYKYPENEVVIASDEYISSMHSAGNNLILASENALCVYDTQTYELIHKKEFDNSQIIKFLYVHDDIVIFRHNVKNKDEIVFYNFESGREIDHKEIIALLEKTQAGHYVRGYDNADLYYYYGQLSEDVNAIAAVINERIENIVFTDKNWSPLCNLNHIHGFWENRAGGYYYNDEFKMLNLYEHGLEIRSDSNENNNIMIEYPEYINFTDDIYQIKDNKILLYGMKYTNLPLLSRHPPSKFSWELHDHIYDVLMTIDLETAEISGWKTRKFERIIYADFDKIITYYKGEYLTYSAQTKEVVSRQPANELKEGERYIFVNCGDYVFVLNGFTGVALNVIEV